MPILLADVARPPIETDAPFYFLAVGFGLMLVIFLLMNLDRRFREYLSRSLIRPYNFFADIRDQRIIPNVQTMLLAICEAGAVGLFATSLLYVFQAVSVEPHSAAISRWMPHEIAPGGTLGLLSIVTFGTILFVTLAMRFAVIFGRKRIYVSDAFNIVVWALLPLSFLLPIDLILPRLDPTPETFSFVVIIFGVLVLWVYQRLMKGIGVLFDVYPTVIYVYGTLVLAALTLAGWAYLT
jgi:hypothetical protein